MKVLIVKVPGAPDVKDLQAMRDYIWESIHFGVLALGERALWGVEDLPELGGVEVETEGDPPETGANADPVPAPASGLPPNFVPVQKGRNALEKQQIMSQMKAYRDAHGLGCWRAVAAAAGEDVTDDLLRDMLIGEKSPPIAVWRRVGKALEKLTAEAGKGAAHGKGD